MRERYRRWGACAAGSPFAKKPGPLKQAVRGIESDAIRLVGDFHQRISRLIPKTREAPGSISTPPGLLPRVRRKTLQAPHGPARARCRETPHPASTTRPRCGMFGETDPHAGPQG